MARLPRYFSRALPLHIILRGSNRTPIFSADADYKHFKGALLDAASRHKLAIHAYALMSNHIHLLASPSGPESVPKTMQSVGRRYVQYFNLRYDHTGTLWEGRYRATAVDTENYLLACMRYIELSPVRAGMVNHPRDYAWSSYAANADGKDDMLITPHGLYISLANDVYARRIAYRDLATAAMNEAVD